jgi:acyl transferase domain-containing protein
MAGRFPGAQNVAEFWQNLLDGKDSIARLTPEELRAEGVSEAALRQPNFVAAGGVLDDIEMFDAAFFGISPREAESMDPQQRIFLETVQHAMDDAALDPARAKGPVSVFAGCRLSGYWLRLLQNSKVMGALGWHQVASGNDKDFLATQTSYRFDLRGPSVNVQAACSTSLLAVSLACDSLMAGSSDVAIAGGVSVAVPHRSGYTYHPSGIASPDGHCRPFDAQAQGSVLGNGAGAVVLKRVQDAVAAGDRIYAIIRGIAVNNDGAAKSSFAAPSVQGQVGVISSALRHAGISRDDVGYIEAHGTATSLGDALEAAALGKVFGGRTELCRIGSVKSNVGHLDPAAGVTSLIKVALSLHHGEIPASIHFDTPNPNIDFKAFGIRVNAEREEWLRTGAPRRAGVSSFGIGGTNVHAVLEEAPLSTQRSGALPAYVLPFSAQSEDALRETAAALAGSLRHGAALRDIAFTLACGRRQFAYRGSVTAGTLDEAEQKLGKFSARAAPVPKKEREVYFLFPGQGAQRSGMGAELYRTEPIFRAVFDRLAAAAAIDFDLRTLVSKQRKQVPRDQNHTSVAQPYLFAIDFALAELWRYWGIKPAAVLGHSLGELAAACVAGVFSPEDGIRLACERGRLMGEMPAGAMVAVQLDSSSAERFLRDGLCISVLNGPRLCAISGSIVEMKGLEDRLAEAHVEFRRLNTSHAFHHSSMHKAAERFLEVLQRVELKEPKIPLLSNLTGDWMTAEEAVDPAMWAHGIAGQVRFSECMTRLLEHRDPLLLECGPGMALSSIARSHMGTQQSVVVTSMPGGGDASEYVSVLAAAGAVWQSGAPLDWHAMWAGREAQRVSLPAYPFQRQRYWVEGSASPAMRPSSPAAGDVQSSNAYVPSWQTSDAPRPETTNDSDTWIVLVDSLGLGLSLCSKLQNAGKKVLAVARGERFEQISPEAAQVNPSDSAEMAEVVKNAAGDIRLINCWTFEPSGELSVDRLKNGIESSFHAPVAVLQAALRAGKTIRAIHTVVANLFDVTSKERPDPAFAPLTGIVRTLGQEIPSAFARAIDVLAPSTTEEAEGVVQQIFAEVVSGAREPVVALRGASRYVQTFQPFEIPPSEAGNKKLRKGGTYVVTGGYGGIGGALAKSIASVGPCNLVLLGRKGPIDGDSLLRDLERMGATVLALTGDVANADDVRRCVDAIHERFGPIHGVIHAAGIAGGGMLATRKRDEADAVFAPKVFGTFELFEAVVDDKPDFFAMCSSFASVHGGIGQADYCGANAFQDAFAGYASASGVAAIAMNWPAWREVGMAARISLPEQLKGVKEASLSAGISVAEGTAYFARMLGTDQAQVILAPASGAPTSAPAKANAAPHRKIVEERAAEEAPPADLRATLERRVAEVWSEVLGVQQANSKDNFFELGGHSLMALQIVSAVRDRFPVTLDLGDVFANPTLGDLAQLIETRLIECVGQIPPEEVQRMLAQGHVAS